MSRRSYEKKTIMSGKATDGVGSNATACSDYEHIILEIATTGTGSATLKIQGAAREIIEDTAVDFSAGATNLNPWAYLEVVNLSSGTAIAGATGISLSAPSVGLYELNCSGIDQLNAIMSSTAGTIGVYVTLKCYSNE